MSENVAPLFRVSILLQLRVIFSYFAFRVVSHLFLLNHCSKHDAIYSAPRSQNFDGGFGSTLDAESHAGQIFCCLGALAIAGALVCVLVLSCLEFFLHPISLGRRLPIPSLASLLNLPLLLTCVVYPLNSFAPVFAGSRRPPAARLVAVRTPAAVRWSQRPTRKEGGRLLLVVSYMLTVLELVF
jgi:hypothetical protein